MLKKNEWIALCAYAAVVIGLCFLFQGYQIIIAILGVMGFTGYMRTRHLVHKSEEK